jgi:hypothetical protein
VLNDNTIILRERLTELTKIIGAINALADRDEWKVLKELVFDGQVERIEKSLLSETKLNELQPAEIYRLQGQLVWARRYSDLYKLAETYKAELINITKKLNENGTI